MGSRQLQGGNDRSAASPTQLGLRRFDSGESPAPVSVVLHWIPVGAGGNGVVTLSARIYEWWQARSEHRAAAPLLHTALEVHIDGVRTVVECAWPSPDRFTQSRGVAVQGPVFASWLGRFRPFRYEVRRWTEGLILDVSYATHSSVVCEDRETADRILDLVPRVPLFEWGRDEQAVGEMWNSNSVIAYVLAGADIDIESQTTQVEGRAPGLRAGLIAARRDRAGSHASGTNDT